MITTQKYSSLLRTSKGLAEVSNKKHKLSARQRQFLLLIDKSDSLNQHICEKLSRSINVKQLIDLGLLSTAKKVADTVAENDTVTNTAKKTLAVQNIEHAKELKQTTSISLEDLPKHHGPKLGSGEFSEIKIIMKTSLQKTSGLLAADLIMRIEKSNTPEQLRRLTARWRTTMLESKFDKRHIHAWFDDVNLRLNG